MEFTGKDPVDAWYEEIKDYDYNNPGFSSETGHFTQLLWKDTTEMAIAYSVSGQTAIAVAHYSPAGNITNEGYFEKNVLPLAAPPEAKAEPAAENVTAEPAPEPQAKPEAENAEEKAEEPETILRTPKTTPVVTPSPEAEPEEKEVEAPAAVADNEMSMFESEALEAHNHYRAMHDAPALQYSFELRQECKRWAEYLASMGMAEDSKTKNGENIWTTLSTAAEISGKDPVTAWYNEIIDYNFNSPGYSTLTCRFTQMVWVESTQMGIAYAVGTKEIFVVAQYSPAGNIMDQNSFQTNVRPKDSLSVDSKDKNDAISQQTVDNEAAVLARFEKEALESHNVYRARHNTAPLFFSGELSKDCKVWAVALSQNGVIAQSPTNFGENIWSNPNITEGEIAGNVAVDSWYSEINDYDFENPGPSTKTEHFTQLIWQETTEMGIAYDVSDKGAFVVAQYKPRGNTPGPESFARNVLPLDASYSKPAAEPASPAAPKEEAPAGEKPTAEKEPAKEPETKEEPAEEQAAEEKLAEEKPAEEKPAEAKPADEQPAAAAESAASPKGEKKKAHRHCPKKKDPKLKKAERSPCDPNALQRSQWRPQYPYIPAILDHVFKSQGSGIFASQLLKSVNEYRKRHGAKPLILNPDVSEKATKWARHLVNSRTLQHSVTSHGENIWCQQSTIRQEVTGQQAADSWYNEIKNYDFSSPGFQKNCGHFTQLVWKDSKEMGVGLASDGKGLTIVVAQFNPAGNITNPGYFTRNVLPAGSKVQEDEGSSAPRGNTSKPGAPETGLLAPTSGEDSGNFAEQLLNSANKYRARHGAQPLILNSQISRDAEKWAKHLVKSRTLKHSDTPYGENIWYQQGPADCQVTGQAVVDSWYNEIKDYDFSSSGFQKNCGHFTQLVWQDSKEMGVGLASDGKGFTVVVAQFNPAGNITNPGYFAKNVLPPGSKVQQGGSAHREKVKASDTPDTGKAAPVSGEDSGNFAEQLLNSANKYRARHGAQPLILNSQISRDAEKWAKHLVKSRTLKHSDTPYGENIWYQQGPADCQVTGQAVVDSWYNEIKDYDFSSSGFQKNCGHFTQLVWQDSKEMGVGLASDGKGFTVVVAQFNPAGNITNPGYFAKNVLPPGSKVQQGGSAHREKVKASDTPDTGKAAPVSGNEKDALIAELLKEHNSLRARHQSPPLQVNPELSIQAKKWAEHLASIKALKHSDTQYGENLWYKWSSNKTLPTGKEVSESWYNEIRDYNFKAPGFSSKTGHFTQLVWKATKEMGAGQATDGKGTFFVVAVYKPAGNISNPGYFKENVLPPRKQ
ncbi:uncharacterized protein LOC134360095 [Mobula hypostoma]|uniref:uncharacterized protein LOC134360095 n=1 Tax=Mobula hypostoma TaxID=723540 RepID=UPI002FC29293